MTATIPQARAAGTLEKARVLRELTSEWGEAQEEHERGPIGTGIDVKASMVERIRTQLQMPAVLLISYEPFAIPLNIGISVLFKVGGLNMARSTYAPLLAAALGVPFQRLIPEFAFAVGRAV